MPVVIAQDREGVEHVIEGAVGSALMPILRNKGGLDIEASFP